MARAHVSEEDAERVHVHRRVVAPREQIRRHMDRRAHYRAAHHRLRLAEAQVGDLRAVRAVQLHANGSANWRFDESVAYEKVEKQL